MRQGHRNKGPVVVSETTEVVVVAGGEVVVVVVVVPAGSFPFRLKPKNIRRAVWSQPRPSSPVSWKPGQQLCRQAVFCSRSAECS